MTKVFCLVVMCIEELNNIQTLVRDAGTIDTKKLY